MRDFFRFSIREFLVLVVCFATCVAVNRYNDFSALAKTRLPMIDNRTLLVTLMISLVLILVLINLMRNRRPPQV